MQDCKSWFAAATVVFMAAGILGAQTFDQTVTGALSKDGALFSQTSDLKASILKHAADAKQAQVDEAAFGGGGGFHGGAPGGGFHGGAPGGGFHGGAPGGGFHPGPGPVGPRPGPVNPGPVGPRPGPGNGPHPGPGPRPGPGGGDWGRWNGHPGWGNGHPGWNWGWDGRGRPIWWVWPTIAIWNAGMNIGCNDYYTGYLNQCYGSCTDGDNTCASYCNGDSDCLDQCSQNSSLCNQRCDDDYGTYTGNYCQIP